MAVQTFNYQNATITFDFGEGYKMVNATQMAKPFNKAVSGFLRLQGTKEYIDLLEDRYGAESLKNGKMKKEVLRVIKGGAPDLQGTWMDEKLALKFAAWLSAGFELWVFDRIDELLKTGETRIIGRDYSISHALRFIADKLDEQDQINLRVDERLEHISDEVDDIRARLTVQDENYFSIAGYCAKHGIHCPLDKAKKWGRAATILSNNEDLHFFKIHDPRFGEVGVYHVGILKRVIGE
ncbi:MAG: KilA-N domain-containing protein [Saprospiraceae bacterium]